MSMTNGDHLPFRMKYAVGSSYKMLRSVWVGGVGAIFDISILKIGLLLSHFTLYMGLSIEVIFA